MIAALFPGQGSQHAGMGKALYQEFGCARAVFEEASDAIRLDLKKLCFDGTEGDLKRTANTQPCLLTVSVAALRVAQAELDFVPAVALGHSLGEYSALVAAGSLPLTQAVRFVRERGGAMQEAVPEGEGAMAAILGLEDEAVAVLCKKATAQAAAKHSKVDKPYTVEACVEPANYNAPGQIVISGSQDAVTEAIALLKEAEFASGKAMLLPVSAPFHCKLMGPARQKMAAHFAGLSQSERPADLLCPYVPNRTARLSREKVLVLELLLDQIDHPVLWKQSIALLLEHGYTRAIEFGPGKVLQGLAKRIAKPLGKDFAVFSLSDPASLKELEREIQSGEKTA